MSVSKQGYTVCEWSSAMNTCMLDGMWVGHGSVYRECCIIRYLRIHAIIIVLLMNRVCWCNSVVRCHLFVYGFVQEYLGRAWVELCTLSLSCIHIHNNKVHVYKNWMPRVDSNTLLPTIWYSKCIQDQEVEYLQREWSRLYNACVGSWSMSIYCIEG